MNMSYVSTFIHTFRIMDKYSFEVNFQFFRTTDEQVVVTMSLGVYNHLTLQKTFCFPMILCSAENISFFVNDYLRYGNGEFMSMNHLSQKLGVPICERMLYEIRREVCEFVNQVIYSYLQNDKYWLKCAMIRRDGI